MKKLPRNPKLFRINKPKVAIKKIQVLKDYRFIIAGNSDEYEKGKELFIEYSKTKKMI